MWIGTFNLNIHLHLVLYDGHMFAYYYYYAPLANSLSEKQTDYELPAA